MLGSLSLACFFWLKDVYWNNTSLSSISTEQETVSKIVFPSIVPSIEGEQSKPLPTAALFKLPHRSEGDDNMEVSFAQDSVQVIEEIEDCRSYLWNLMNGCLGLINEYSNISAIDVLDLLELWIDVLARGAPGDWMEIGNGNEIASFLASAVVKAGAKSHKCIHKYRRTVWVSDHVADESTPISKQYALADKVSQSFGIEPDDHANEYVEILYISEWSNHAISADEKLLLALLHIVDIDNPPDGFDTLGMYARVAAGGYIAISSDSTINFEEKLSRYFGEIEGANLVISPDKSNLKWFRKPISAAVNYGTLKHLLLEASYQAHLNSPKKDVFKGMGHSFESDMETRALRRAANYVGVKHICEIGFNAGHSAIIFLASNPMATLTSFDLGSLTWSKAMVQHVKGLFPGRFTYIQGNSFNTVPAYGQRLQAHQEKHCDLFFVDGDHSYEAAKKDFHHALQVLSDVGYLMADDHTYHFPGVIKAWNELLSSSKIEEHHCEDTPAKFRGVQKGWCVGRKVMEGIRKPTPRDIHVITSQCIPNSYRIQELNVMIKSMLVSSDPLDKLHLHIILDSAAEIEFRDNFAFMESDYFSLSIYNFDDTVKDLFRICSTQSLSAYKLVNSDYAIFLDGDTLVLDSLWALYEIATKLGQKIVGMSEEGGDWYTNPKRHGKSRAGITYVPKTGVNGGVLALNLKLMRDLDFSNVLMQLYDHYNELNYEFTLGDQDLLNLYFAQNPELLELVSCKFNTRIGGSKCDCCLDYLEDSTILHGNRGAFAKNGTSLNRMWREFADMNSSFHAIDIR